MEQLNLQELIKEITPLYNSYKQSSRNIGGVEALYIMWDIGDLLKKRIDSSNIAPHNLYRKIYGKAESQSNITQKSYITREFLGRAYRVRNIFKDKDHIKNILPKLKSFILFREAMPFFDNSKYILTGKEMENLLIILNSSDSKASILEKIRVLQFQKIGKKNSRIQKLGELESEKQTFISFYNYLFNLIKNFDYISSKKDISNLQSSTIIDLSSITSCLSQEGLKYPQIPEDKFSDQWILYVELLKKFSSQKDPRERRRFRRLVSPTRIVKVAEMLNALSSEDSFKNFKGN